MSGNETEADQVRKLAHLMYASAADDGATVVHIDPQADTLVIRFRVDNRLHDVLKPPKQVHRSLVDHIKAQADMDVGERRVPQIGRLHLSLDQRDFLVDVSSYPCVHGEKLVLQIYPQAAPQRTLEELGLSPENLARLEAVLGRRSGIVLFAGGSRSGRTTSLYACTERLRQDSGNIFTVEETVSRKFEGVNQLQLNPKCGLDGPAALRSIMRGDPDIVVIESMDTREMTRLALQAYRPGRLLLASCDAEDAARGVMHLLSAGDGYLVGRCLGAVVAQRLFPRVCEACRQQQKAPGGIPGLEEGTAVYEAAGCQECRKVGAQGLIGVQEVLANSGPVQEAISRYASLEEMHALVEAPMRNDALDKVKTGLISLEEFSRAF